MKKIYFLTLISIFFISCEPKNEDIVTEPNKDGSIETVVSVKHEQDFDILTTTHKIWVKNQLDKTLIKVDTLKSLGLAKVEGEDENGNTKQGEVRKDYEFYITVK